MEISTDTLIHYLDNPETLDQSSNKPISDLISKFPFFQTARLLHIKNLQQINKTVEKHTLNLTAAYVVDRKVLYYLLYKFNQTSPDEENIPVQNASPNPVEKEYKDSLKENIAETINKQLHYYEFEPSHEIEIIPGLAIDVRKEYGDGIELDYRSFSLGPKKDSDTAEIFELDNDSGSTPLSDEGETVDDTITSADELPGFIGSDSAETDHLLTGLGIATFDFPEDTGSTEAIGDTQNTGHDEKVDGPGSPPESSISTADEKNTSETEMQAQHPSGPILTEGVRSFNEWLDSVGTATTNSGDSSSKSTEAANLNYSTSLTFREIPTEYKADEPGVEKVSPENKEKKEKNDSLIENFIKTNPRIMPAKLPEAIEDISVDSIKEHESFFTDTLAQIYIKQGNYAKAILAYEKLSLKYPEKSTYFAGQILDIKKRISKS